MTDTLTKLSSSSLAVRSIISPALSGWGSIDGVALIEVPADWSMLWHYTHAVVVNLATLDARYLSDVDCPRCPGRGEALVLTRRLGPWVKACIVVPAGAVDHDAVMVAADALQQGDGLMAGLVASAVGAYGRVVLALAESRVAELGAISATEAA